MKSINKKHRMNHWVGQDELDTVPGIYKIVNNVTKQTYIGASVNIRHRVQVHQSQLRAGTHPIEQLQADYDNGHEFYTGVVLNCNRRELGRYEEACRMTYAVHKKLYNTNQANHDGHGRVSGVRKVRVLHRNIMREWRAKNREHYNEYHRQYRAAHKA